MNRQILIVEDEAPIREMISFVLDQNGFNSLEAADIDSAKELIKEPYPDLILLDWMLPGGTGVKLAKALKQNEYTRNIPIIMLTARASLENEMEGFETGADAYIVKPYNEDLLKTRINNLLNNRRLIREKFINDNLLTPQELAISSQDQLFLEALYKSLESNLESNNIKAEIISTEIGMSHSVMYKKIKALTGLTYVEFIRDYRLSIAKQLINDMGYSVSEACYKVGYSDRKYFSKLFKKKFKKNPSEFLKS